MPDTTSDVQDFHLFLSEQIAVGTEKSPEELLASWRARQREFDETVIAIREGLDDVAAGRTTSLEAFEREFRQRHDLPAKDDR